MAVFKKCGKLILKILLGLVLTAITAGVIYFISFTHSIYAKRYIELTPLGTINCQFDPSESYSGISPYVFHSLESITDFPFMNSHTEVVAFARTFDFARYDLVVDFGYAIKKMYHTKYSFEGKLIPQFIADSEFHENVVYIYSFLKDADIADDSDFPFSNPVDYT